MDNVEDLRRRPRPLPLRFVKRYRGTWRCHAGDGAGPQQNKLLLLQQVRPLQERLRRLQGSPSLESVTQTTSPQAARQTSTGSAEAGRAAAAEGRGANVVLISQVHHPQRRQVARHAGKRAQRQRPLHLSPSSERSWDLQFMGPPYAR